MQFLDRFLIVPRMANDSGSTERQRNLWAPWRMEYIDALSEGEDGCFLCRYRDEPGKDRENLVLWRTGRCFSVMNRFPYTGGHTLIAPYEHVPSLSDLPRETMADMMELLRDAQEVLRETLRAQGFNIGINVGRCAGAGLPGHIHMHIVPRWEGDTNFMAVFGGARVIPQALQRLHEQLLEAGRKLHLPKMTA